MHPSRKKFGFRFSTPFPLHTIILLAYCKAPNWWCPVNQFNYLAPCHCVRVSLALTPLSVSLCRSLSHFCLPFCLSRSFTLFLPSFVAVKNNLFIIHNFAFFQFAMQTVQFSSSVDFILFYFISEKTFNFLPIGMSHGLLGGERVREREREREKVKQREEKWCWWLHIYSLNVAYETYPGTQESVWKANLIIVMCGRDLGWWPLRDWGGTTKRGWLFYSNSPPQPTPSWPNNTASPQKTRSNLYFPPPLCLKKCPTPAL